MSDDRPRPDHRLTLAASFGLGLAAALDVAGAILATSHLALVSRDALAIVAGSLLVVLPLAAAACLVSAWLLGRFLGGGRALAVVLAIALLCLVGLVLKRPSVALHHLALALFLAAGLWLLARGRRSPAAWLACAGLASLAALGIAAVRSGLFPKTTAPLALDPTTVTPRHTGRILLVGLDGLGIDTLARWRKTAESDDFRWLAQRLQVGPLKTFVPTDSPIIWTTIATGLPARQHGVAGFTSWSAAGTRRPLGSLPRGAFAFAWAPLAEKLGLLRERPVSTLDMRRPPFWEILADSGRPCDVVAWWATAPALPIEGRLVSDKFFFFRDQLKRGDQARLAGGTVYPAELETQLSPSMKRPADVTTEEILRFIDVPREEAAALANRPYRHGELLSELPLAYAMDETYYAVAEQLLATQKPGSFSAFYFRGVDILSHAAIAYSNLYPESRVGAEERQRYGEAISRYYAYTFTRLRRLLERAGDDALVMVVSDHGFEQLGPSFFGHSNAPPGILFTSDLGGRKDGEASVYDVAPTLLWLAGYPQARDMPGRPLKESFPAAAGALPETGPIASYGGRVARKTLDASDLEGADAQMMELLRSLGYIN